MNRSFIVGLIALLLVVGVSFASETEMVNASDNIIVLQGDDYYYDEESGLTYTTIYTNTDNGGFEKVSFEEFFEKQRASEEEFKTFEKQLGKKQEVVDDSDFNIQSNPMFGKFPLNYTETSYGLRIGSYQVINDYHCPSNSNGCNQVFSVSASESESFSTGITANAKGIVTASASFSWTSSASVQASYGLSIPAGSVGWIVFFPESNVTYGDLDYVTYILGIPSYSTESVHAISPKTLQTGELKGNFYGVIDGKIN